MALKQVFRTGLTDVDTSEKDNLGDLRFESGKWYKYVKIMNTTATVAGVAGDPVAYFAGATGPSTPRVVLDLTDADPQPVCAGFLMGTVTGTLTTAYYGWIQLSGIVTVPTAVAGTPVIGSGVMLGTTDKELTKVTGVIYPVGVQMVASGANNTILATCPR